jgi:hypothetical protein
MLRTLPIVALVLLLAACTRGLEGTYADEVGFMSFAFRDDGSVVQSTLGVAVEMRYTQDGDRILIEAPGATLELVRVDERTLEGTDGLRLTRQDP